MTQRDDGHDYRDSKNKAMAHEKKTNQQKYGVALAGLNNQINRLNQLDPSDTYTKQQLSTIIDDLTDVLIDLKMETGVDV